MSVEDYDNGGRSAPLYGTSALIGGFAVWAILIAVVLVALI